MSALISSEDKLSSVLSLWEAATKTDFSCELMKGQAVSLSAGAEWTAEESHVANTQSFSFPFCSLPTDSVCFSVVTSDLRNITLDLSFHLKYLLNKHIPAFSRETTSFYSSVSFRFATSGQQKTGCKHTSTFYQLYRKYGELVSKQLPFKHPAATKQH